MRHPLEVKLKRYRARARLYSALTASGYLLAIYTIMLLLLSLLDWYWRPTNSAIRVFFWLLALSPLLYIPVSLYQAFRRRRSNIELATELEHNLPPLRNWLAGAIDFLQIKKETPTAGSKELRDAVVDRATELSGKLDFSSTLDRQPVYRSLGMMAFILGMTTIIVALNPNAALTASRRLTQPLTPTSWPSKTLLVVKKTPLRLARGSLFQATVADERGRKLPEEAKVFYRFTPEQTSKGKTTEADQATASPTIEIETIRTDGQQIVLLRNRVNRSFAFRVTAGDDERMSWQEVEVVDPPTVESLKVAVSPPPYIQDMSLTMLPVKDKTCIREGSRARFIAEVSKPVRRATLLLGDEEYEGQITQKGLRIIFPAETSITIDHSSSIALQLEDEMGLEVTIDGSQQIEMIENRPPVVTLLHPKNAERVIAEAVLPIVAVVEDDLGVQSASIHWAIHSVARPEKLDSPSGIVSIYEGPEKLPDTSQLHGGCPVSQQKSTLDYRWNLASLKLKPGDRIILHAEATDYSGIRTASEPVEITVVTQASFIDQLVSAQQAINDEMAQALAISEQNHRRMTLVQQQQEQHDQVRTADLDQLRAILLDRRQVVRTLTDDNDGLIARSSAILSQLDNSQLRAETLRNRLVQLIANLEMLRSRVLPEIEQGMTLATKNAELALDTQNDIHVEISEVVSPLSDAILGQKQLIEKLRTMLGQLGEIVDYQRFCDDLRQLILSQQAVTEQTKNLGRSLLGRIKTDLDSTERDQLSQVSRDQARLARESEQAVHRMIQASQHLSEEDNRIASAVQSPQARSLGATLTQASEAILQNQLGRAVKLQTESLAELEAMQAKLTQTAGPVPEETSGSQEIQINGDQPGDTEEPGAKPGTSPQQDKPGRPGDQANEAASFSQSQPLETPTHLKPQTVDHLIERFWGELPERERTPIIQLPGERFLPGYERQIEDYYRRLLEQ